VTFALGVLAVLSGLIGAATHTTAAWAVLGIALALGVAYRAILAHMRRLAVEREMTVAFGPALGLDAATWDEFAGDLALTCGEGADRAPVIAGEREAVAIFVAGWLLAWALTPVVAVIRFVRGDISELRGRGILDRVVRAQQYGRSQSLKVLMSVSVAATAAVPGVGIAANASLAGAALGAPGQPMTSTVVRIARAEVAAAATGHLVASTVAEMAAGASTAGALPAPLAQLLASTSTASLGTQASSYTVRAGDSLSDIAEQFGATVASLAAANGIANPNRISTGEVSRSSSRPTRSPPATPSRRSVCVSGGRWLNSPPPTGSPTSISSGSARSWRWGAEASQLSLCISRRRLLPPNRPRPRNRPLPPNRPRPPNRPPPPRGPLSLDPDRPL
jgi:LysM repeat protein